MMLVKEAIHMVRVKETADVVSGAIVGVILAAVVGVALVVILPVVGIAMAARLCWEAGGDVFKRGSK